MKRSWFVLGLMLVMALTPALAGKLPTDVRFDAVIKGVLFPPDPKQPSPTKPLDLVLEALAKSVGLQTLIYREYDDKGQATLPRMPNIKFDFQGKKFREIWDLLFNTYGLQLGLDFVVLGNNTVVVAPNELISGLADATQRTGEAQRQLYLVDIPGAAYLDKEGKADYDKAKVWVKDNFIPFVNREFGGLAINWLVVESGKQISVGAGGTTVEISVLRVLVSVLGSESQQLKIQETLARSRYGFEVMPTALELAAIQAAATPPEEPEKPTERIFTLRNTNFSEISAFLVAAIPGLAINPLPTNPAAALFKGTPTQLRRVSDLLPQLDVARPTPPEIILSDRTINLKNVAFSEVRDFLLGQLPKVVIAPIPTNPKAAVVRGSEADLVRLNELIAVIDLPKLLSAEQERQLYLVDIPASSYQVQSSVQVQENGRSETRSETKADYDKAKGWVRDNFLPFANREFESPATNWIVVEVGQTLKLLASIVASPAQQLRFQETLVRSRFGFEILPSVDLNRPATPEIETRVFTLKHAGFAAIKSFLEGQLPKITIAISPTNPSLAIVRGTSADLSRLAELIALVDIPAPPAAEPPSPSEQLFTLKNTGFDGIKGFLEAAIPGVVVQVIPTNVRSALVRGSKAQLSRVSELLAQIDIAPILPGPSTAPAVVKPYALNTLGFADLNRLYQQSLKAYLPNTTLREITSTPGAFTLEATPDQHQLFGEMLARVDRPETARLSEQVQVVPLAHADPNRVARLVRQYYPNTPISVVGKNLIFKATPLDTYGLINLISKVDTPTPEQKVFPLNTRETASLEAALRRALLAKGVEVNVRTALGDQPDGTGLDETTNPLQLAPASIELLPGSQRMLVTGPVSLFELVEQLLPTLDPPIPAIVEVPQVEKLVTLQHVPFATVREFLAAQLPKLSLSIVPTNPKLALARGTAAELERLMALLQVVDVAAPVTLPVDTPRLRQVYSLQNVQANAVIANLKSFLARELPGARLEEIPGNPGALWFEGSQAQINEFDRLLKVVDIRLPTPEPVLERRSFTLLYADAAQVAEIVRRDFSGSTVDVVGKQLIVRAPAAQLDELANLLSSLDVARAALVQKTYILSHAQATALAPVLAEAIGARNRATANTPSTTGTGATPSTAQTSAANSSTISIVADERTNALVVTGEASMVALVDGLVAQLDQPVPQVNIQVRVQEVSSSVVNNLGLRWETVAGGNVLASLLETGLSLIFDSTRSLASLNLRVTLDALQEQGLSRTFNDSNITVLNNQTGRIQSGQTIFLRQTQEGATGDRGGTTEQVPFEIGVIVEVTPRIAADGSIVMQIVTDISGSNLQRNPTDGLIDRFDRQSSSSSLRIKDGQTIVLGGLIQKRTGQNSSGIPFLSEIPLLGSLFKQQKFDDSDRELLIVITGNIVKDTPARGR